MSNKNLENLTLQELNNNVFDHVLEKTFYNNWKKFRENSALEIIFSPICNQQCSYCYLNKDNQNIYSCQEFDVEKSIANVIKLLEWLEFKQMVPSQMDIFSGEFFAQEAGYQLLESIAKFYEEHSTYHAPEIIVIPTNGTFAVQDSLIERIKSYIFRFKNFGTRLVLSFSIDGLYAGKITRKYKKDLDFALSSSYTSPEEFYEKAFAFMSETECLPHPMISPENVSAWKENFLWYEDIMNRHHMNFFDLYILEVRNYNWTEESYKAYEDFLLFVLDYMRKKFKTDDEFLDWVLKNPDEYSCSGFNFLASFAICDRTSPSCTMGRHLMVRADDLKVFPCHRLVYPDLEIGQYVPDEEEKLKFNVVAPELGIAIASFNPKNQNACSRCPINYLCMGQCHGSCHETLGDMFTPIPTVCHLIYRKLKAELNYFKENNLLNGVLERINSDIVIKQIISFVERELGEKK